MTKKDYNLIASVIHTWQGAPSLLIDQLCLALKDDNIKFNAEKFRAACLWGATSEELYGTPKKRRRK